MQHQAAEDFATASTASSVAHSSVHRSSGECRCLRALMTFNYTHWCERDEQPTAKY
jgi:hypothetical protein